MLANQIGLSEKYVSENHFNASLEKLTLGEAALIYSKKVEKISAFDLGQLYREHFKQSPEWHHSGFYKKGRKTIMGKTYFISMSELFELIDAFSVVK